MAQPQPLAAALGGFLALAAALGIGRFVYTPILPFMLEAGQLTSIEAGLVASANFLGYLVGALLAGRYELVGSRQTWLLGTLLISGITTAVMPVYDTPGYFLAFRFFNGVAGAAVMVIASALVLDHLALSDRQSLASIPYAGVGAGIALSAILAPVAASGDLDWKPLWIAAGAVCLVLTVPLVWLLPDLKTRIAVDHRPAAQGMPHKKLWHWIVAYGLVGFGYVTTATFIADLARSSVHLRPVEALVWFAVGISAIPSVVFWVWLGRKWQNRWAFAVACVCEAVGVVLSVISESVTGLLIAACLLGGTLMGLTALGLIEARKLCLHAPHRGLAQMTAAFGLGQVVGPSISGLLHDQSGSYVVPSLLAAGGLAIGAMMMFAAPRSGTEAAG